MSTFSLLLLSACVCVLLCKLLAGQRGMSKINLLSVVNLLAQNLSAYCLLFSSCFEWLRTHTHGNIPMSSTSFNVADVAAAANACVK